MIGSDERDPEEGAPTFSWASVSPAPDELSEELGRRQLAGVWRALNSLRAATTLDRLLELAPRQVCRACGLDRVVISRVEDSKLMILGAHFEQREEDVEGFLAHAKADPPAVSSLPVESEVVRRRTPVLVAGKTSWPGGEGPTALSTGSYVAAPIVSQQRVIGLIHADRSDAGPPLTDSDRDVVGTIAETLGHAFSEALLLDRLRRQRTIVRGQLVSIQALLDEAESEIELAPPGEAGDDLARIAAGMFVAPEAGAESPAELLTRRELEVLSLLAAGATNAEIAERLVISETTVKSHVQRILRKLRASNRAEAVSLYLRRTTGSGL